MTTLGERNLARIQQRQGQHIVQVFAVTHIPQVDGCLLQLCLQRLVSAPVGCTCTLLTQAQLALNACRGADTVVAVLRGL